MGFHTLDDFGVRGKRVLLRIDVNSPVDEKTLRLEDGSKIKSSVATVRELIDRGARTAVLAHQGRPGDYDYIPLNEHAAYLTQYLGRKVRYLDDLLGVHALKAVQNLADGECILLKNVRDFPEEQAKKTPEEHAQGQLVRILAPSFDLFVNDAFGSSHRSHASLVGFTAVLPSAAGRLMENEIKTLTKVFQNPKRPSTYIFGGTKFADALTVIEKLADRPSVDHILIAGLAGYAFLLILGKRIGARTEKKIQSDLTPETVERAKALHAKHSKKIVLPSDAAIDSEGRRKECGIDDVPADAAIMDIGERTAAEFCKVIEGSKTVFLSGPPGVFEKDEFSKGTQELFRAIVSSEAFSVIGGGHSSAAANKLGVKEQFSYVSTGGGALERLMLGKEMPAVEALRASAKRL
ncbi:MAG: phosphoglycerate kinase [Euryarchaeota archaeon RBG_16_62_10]|nr:MAG: phosphoglycerate kinase [Euryarchaeota archaeon RBG_16_62_10]